MNILDYFKYAALSTAAYVRMGDKSLDGATFVDEASSIDQSMGRLPLSIAQYLFDPQSEVPNANKWTIAYYHADDKPGVDEKSGFGATLFQNSEENVLAIRGAEAGLTDGDIYRDLIGASLGGIGLLGVAVTQLVDLVNLIERLYTPEGQQAKQIKAVLTPILPGKEDLEDGTTTAIELKGALEAGPVGSLPIPLYLVLTTYDKAGLGTFDSADKITLTGHSLGGHLAAAASMIFPERVNGEVFAYNAPGFDPSTWDLVGVPLPSKYFVLSALFIGVAAIVKGALGDPLGSGAGLLDTGGQQQSHRIVNALQAFFATPVGAAFPVVHSLESEDSLLGDDASLIASALAGSTALGAEITVPTEINSHSIEQLMDALALHATLYRLDNVLTLTTLKKFVDAAEKNPGASEEVLVEALHGLLVADSLLAQDGLQLAISDASKGFDRWTGKGEISARDAYHTAILEINKKLDELDLGATHVVSMMDDSAGPLSKQQLIDRASSGPDEKAFRYALRKLMPFAVTGIDYSMHNANGELDRYIAGDEATGSSGTLTDEWIRDRAEFLYAKNIAFRGDQDLVAAPGLDEQLFVDLAELFQVFTTSVGGDGQAPTIPSNPKRIVFSGDRPDVLEGGGEADRLYGGGGIDYLEGKAGDDYLEGGTGLDVYQYSASEAGINSNDGNDTILDTDGRGILRYTYDAGSGLLSKIEDFAIADASVKLSGNQWRSADGKFTYTMESNDLRVTLNDAAGRSLLVKDWREGELNIHLGMRGVHAEPQTSYEFVGDFLPNEHFVNVPADFTPAPDWAGIQILATQVDGDGRPIIHYIRYVQVDAAGNALPAGIDTSRADNPQDTAGNDRIRLLGGNDYFFDRYGGDDWISGGKGRDYLDGGRGNDLLEGGGDDFGEGDIISGGAGDDDLFGNVRITLAQTFSAEFQNIASTVKGDWLNGGPGDDYIVGYSGNDVLMGGLGSDLLIGGAGDDNLDGDDDYTATTFEWTATATSNPFDSYFTPITNNNVVPLAGSADVLYGGSGNDRLYGGFGDDVLYGGAGNDVMAGGHDNDILVGGDGNDTMTGDADELIFNDTGSVNQGDDYLDGGAGDDWLQGEGGNDVLLGGADNDSLVGDAYYLDAGLHGDDYLAGGEGNDSLFGLGGDDVLWGGPGEDILVGGAGKDTYIFHKGDGVESIFDEDDQVTFDPNGQPRIANPDRSIILVSGLSRDALTYRKGSLLLDFGDGDAIHLQGFDDIDPRGKPMFDYLAFDDGSRVTYDDVLAQGFDIDGTDSDDSATSGSLLMLVGTAVTDRIRGHGGNDILVGLAGDDTLDGGAGADYLQGGPGDDRYIADLSDTIEDSEGHNSITLASGVTPGALVAQQLTIQGEPFVVLSLLGASEIAPGLPQGLRIKGNVVQQDFDFTFADGTQLAQWELYNTAFTQSVSVQGGNGDDIMTGYGGDDVVRGRSGDDLMIGGHGNDLLIGDHGSDIYVFEAGDGQDVIDEQGLIAIGIPDIAGFDIVWFGEGISAQDVSLLRQYNGDLILRYAADDQLIIKGHYNSPGNSIEGIAFADGTFIDFMQLAAIPVAPIEGTDGADVLSGTDAADTLLGLDGDDVLDGGAGNDRLEGGAGADTYRMYAGMGMDTVIDRSDAAGSLSTLQLAPGYSLASLKTQRSGDDLSIFLRGSSDGMRIHNYYAAAGPAQRWQVQTADDSRTDIEILIGLPDPFASDVALAAREAYRQSLAASWGAISVAALPTHANVFSSWSQTTVTTYGADPNQPPQIEVLNPVTYKNIHGYGVTQGSDIVPANMTIRSIQSQLLSTQSDDAVIGLAGLATESSSYETHFVMLLAEPRGNRNVSSTTYQSGTTSKSTVVSSTTVGWVPIALDRPGAVDGALQLTRVTEHRVIEQIDAGASDNAIAGAIGGDGSHVALIDAGGGNDSISAGAFDFVYGGDGDDVIHGGHIVYGGNGEDALYGDTAPGIAVSYLYGGAGNDHLYGGRSILSGGEGDDAMTGSAGATVFVIDAQDGGIDSIVDTGSVSQAQIENWTYQALGIAWPAENLQFGGRWSVVGESGFALDRFYRNPGEFENLLGEVNRFYRDLNGYPSDAKSTVYASLNDLRIEFAALGITYQAEDIRYIAPLPAIPQVRANDYAALQPLYDAGIIDQDVVAFLAGVNLNNLTAVREQVTDGAGVRDSALVLSWANGHSVRVALAQRDDPIGTGVERYQFADGSSISTKDLLALAMPVVLHQAPHDFNFLPGSGNRVLEAHYTHIYFDATIEASSIAISRSDEDLVISRIGSSDRLSIPNWYADPDAMPTVSAQFYNGGSILSADALTVAGLTVHGGATDDTLSSLDGFENSLYGEAGNDVLIGGDREDYLDGGAGDDWLVGNAGSDTYVFGNGSGSDLIEEGDDQPGVVDTVSFAPGILSTDVAAYLTGENLILAINGSNDTLTVQGQIAEQSKKIERFIFGNGAIWDAALVEAMAVTLIAGTAENDILAGTAGNDRLNGADGDDILFGLEADDRLIGGPGDDTLFGGLGNDTYQYNLGDGNDVIHDGDAAPGDIDTLAFGPGIFANDIRVSADETNLYLALQFNGQQITMANWAQDPASRIERVAFADGSSWSADDLDMRSRVGISYAGSDDAEYALGTLYDDYFDMQGGDDSVDAGSGHDVIDGGRGNDYLQGGEGDDTYVYGPAYGIDGIDDSDGNDVLRFGEGIEPGDMLVTRDPYGTLYLEVGGPQNRVEIYDSYTPENRIERVEFFDGTLWDVAAMQGLVTRAPATEFGDILNLSDDADVLDALGGDDQIFGNGGNDMLLGGEGNDYFEAGSGNNLIDGGAGNDFIYDHEGTNFVIGGPGDDTVYHSTHGGVVAFNPGDGNDTVYVAGDVVLSIGGGVDGADLSLGQDGTDLILFIGGNDSIRLSSPWEAEAQIGSTITLQLFGSVHSYDFNAVIAAFQAQAASDPALVLSLVDVLPAHQVSYSADQALGGALAWHYARAGNLDALTEMRMQAILDNPAFAVALQPVSDVSLNHAPVLVHEIAKQSATEDTAFSFMVPADTFADADAGDTLGYSATLADGAGLPAWLEFDSLTGRFHGTPANDDVESLLIQVTATDAGGLSATGMFEVMVVNVNDAPIPVADFASVKQGRTLSLASDALLRNDYDDDPTLDILSIVAVGNGSHGTMSMDENARIWFIADYGYFGAASFDYQLSDGNGGLAWGTVSVEITPNAAPVVAVPLGDQYVIGGADHSFSVPGTTFHDEDPDDQLIYTATLHDGTALPGWLTFDAGGMTFFATPDIDVVGVTSVRISATDLAGAQAHDTFEFVVAPLNLRISGTTGDDVLRGGAGADELLGLAGNDTLYGRAGTDILDGGAGADKLFGGAGDDIYYVDNAGDIVSEFHDEGNDTVLSSISFALGINVENLTLTGVSKINGTGNAHNNRIVGNVNSNTLTGGAGDDYLDGGAGKDTLIGGTGNDTYVIDSSADKITENEGEGIDLVLSAINFTLDDNLENLVLTRSAVKGTGNDLDNLVVGNALDNTLKAGSGRDILQGLGGDDDLKNTSGSTVFDGGAGDDTLTGSGSRELFIGGAGNDTITTGKAADIIAFNAGDGQDLIKPGTATDNTISLGGGINYEALVFSKVHNDLVLSTGDSDRLTLRDWYAHKAKPGVLNLQVVAEAMAGFDPHGSNPLLDNKIERFDFSVLTDRFDLARAANPALSQWSLSNALLDAHLTGSDSEAIGGDLAYRYGLNGTLTGIDPAQAQDVLKAPGFGSAAQQLRGLQELQAGQSGLS